jgi:3-hydroxyisobutyrate dehydrogenase
MRTGRAPPLEGFRATARQETHRMTVETTIGFAGLGNMGGPMVRCLVKAGYRVRAFDVRPEARAPFAGVAGVELASDLAATGDGLEVAITMLPDSKVVRRAVLGEEASPGLASRMPRGGIVVDMSSSFPPDTQALAEDLAEHGVSVVDAPVSGGVGKAVTGTLAIMAGGAAADVERVTPVLQAMGQVHPTGPLGSGHAMKALNNYVSAAGLIATCEALVIGRRFGLDPAVMTTILNASTGRNNTTENKVARFMLSGKFDSGFALALMEKDVGMAEKLAEQLGIPAPELAMVRARLSAGLAALGATADHTEMYRFVSEQS